MSIAIKGINGQCPCQKCQASVRALPRPSKMQRSPATASPAFQHGFARILGELKKAKPW